MSVAGRIGGVTAGAIYNVCIGKSKTSYGHEFMFYEEYLDMVKRFKVKLSATYKEGILA